MSPVPSIADLVEVDDFDRILVGITVVVEDADRDRVHSRVTAVSSSAVGARFSTTVTVTVAVDGVVPVGDR